MATNLALDDRLVAAGQAPRPSQVEAGCRERSTGRIRGAEAPTPRRGSVWSSRVGSRLRLQGGAQAPVRVLVDTSVWSQALRKGSENVEPAVQRLRELLQEGRRPSSQGLILQEVLQGFRDDAMFRTVARRLEAFPLLQLDRAHYVASAQLRRVCAATGIAASTGDLPDRGCCDKAQLSAFDGGPRLRSHGASRTASTSCGRAIASAPASDVQGEAPTALVTV